jgi:hypothetical protein
MSSDIKIKEQKNTIKVQEIAPVIKITQQTPRIVIKESGTQGKAGNDGIDGEYPLIVQPNEPDVEDRDKLWVDTDDDVNPLMPVGGTTGQYLTKDSNDDWDTSWQTITLPTVPVTSVNGELGDVILEAEDIPFDDSVIDTATAGNVTGNTVQEIISNLGIGMADGFESVFEMFDSIDQSYAQFVYNSSTPQDKNRYNDWQALMSEIQTGQYGPSIITFEQNETLPPGDYNLDYVTLNGNGTLSILGGLQITLPQGFHITSWAGGRLDSGLGITYTGTDVCFDMPEGINTLRLDFANSIQTTSGPFIKASANVIAVLFVGVGGSLYNSGYEIVELDTPIQFITIVGGLSSSVPNNVYRGTFDPYTALLLIDSASSTTDPNRTDANISSPVQVVISSQSGLISYDHTASGLSANTVKDAIDELAGGGDKYGGLTYIGTWSAGSGNINFADGSSSVMLSAYTATIGDVLRVRTAGTADVGNGSESWTLNDLIWWDGSIWRRMDYITHVSLASALALKQDSSSALTLGSTSTTAHRGDHGASAYTHSQLTSGNPHNVTKSDVGLSNADNTSDVNKPVSTAQASAIALKQSLSEKNNANGYAGLDGTGKVPVAQLPASVITDTFVVGSQASMLALTAERGDVAIRTDLNKTFILQTDSPTVLADWKEMLTPTDAVSSVNGRAGAVTGLAEQTSLDTHTANTSNPHSVTKSQVGLGNADNTSDVNKPVSTAQATADALKFDKLNGILTGVASPTYAAGKLVYDTDNDSLTFFNSDSNVSLQVGQEMWIRVKNVSGSTIANGSAVYIDGANSGYPTIALAQANSSTTTVCVGLTTEGIANNAVGFVTCMGLVNGLNTSGFTAGATVFLSSSVAGGLTTTAPTSPNYRYRVGKVGTSHATTGTIHVTPSTASVGNGTQNQLLTINSTGNQAFRDIVRVNTVASSATPTINTDTTDHFTITALATNITSMTTNLSGAPVDGQRLMLRFKDDGSPRTITWGGSFISSGSATLLATTVATKTHLVALIYDGIALKWVCVSSDATGY